MKYDKQYHVISAIYRMLRQRRINFADANNLLQGRAKLRQFKADQLVSIWRRPILRRWEMDAAGLDYWGRPLTD